MAGFRGHDGQDGETDGFVAQAFREESAVGEFPADVEAFRMRPMSYIYF